MRVRNSRDLASSLIVLAAGLFFIVNGLSHPMGTTTRMGAGFYPVLLGVIAVILAAFLLVPALTRDGHVEPLAWRPFLAVSAAIAAFALTLRTLGVAPAIFATVLVSAFADRTARPRSTVIVAIGIVIGTWLIFIRGLGIPLPLFRMPF
ncbi:MAG TPA: tripartite tricarboxylate transporter TctB family protein [Afifellaceae bacterium]|nr:tripartite tricarboxylate transporter TctB family protein [Afifellaceae bacterium]